MANQCAKLFEAYVKSQEYHIDTVNDSDNILRMGFDLNATEISIFITFSEDEDTVALHGMNFIKIPKGKSECLYKICNECNTKYRWVKFGLDEENEVLVVRADAWIQLDNCADVTFKLVHSMAEIVDEVYPVFMKALWG